MIFIFIEYLSETLDLCKDGNKFEGQINQEEFDLKIKIMTDIKYVKINILNLFDIKSNNKKYPLNFDFIVRDKKNKNFSSNGIYFITEKKVNKIVGPLQ